MGKIHFAAAFLASLSASSPAFAKCEEALVNSTFSALESNDSNWQLAQMVDERTYNSRRSGAGASATIYGIPMGGSYNQFRQNVSSRLNSTNSRWSSSQINNVLWTGLDPASTSAYSACLNSEIFSQPGLQAAVVGSGDTNILVRVRWYVPGTPGVANVTWTEPEIGGTVLRTNFPQGDATISIPRPASTIVLAASYGGYTTAPLVLEPLPEYAPFEPTVTENIARGRRFVVVIDPNADLSGLTLAYDYSEQRRESLSGGQIIVGQFVASTNRWISRFSTYAREWCTDPACPASGTTADPYVGRILRRVLPSNQEIVIGGHELTFNDKGELLHEDRVVGFVVIPRFEID